MGESERELVHSESVKAGKRIYYFDVKQSRNGDRYISITESKKINEGTLDNPHFVFEKHKLFLYKEDYEKFVDALTRALDIAKGDAPAEAPAYAEAPAAVEAAAPAVEAAEETLEKKSFLDKVKDIF